MSETAACKTCGQPIRWVKTANGKAMPLDVEPCEDGNLVVVDGVAFSAYTLDVQEGRQRFKSHFATCPQAKQHRR